MENFKYQFQFQVSNTIRQSLGGQWRVSSVVELRLPTYWFKALQELNILVQKKLKNKLVIILVNDCNPAIGGSLNGVDK